jgi:hypothetical protein
MRVHLMDGFKRRVLIFDVICSRNLQEVLVARKP